MSRIARALAVTSAFLTLILFNCGCRHRASAFYPIGLYSVAQADLPLIRDAGFNLVTGPASQDYLDAASQNGLRVLASPGTSAGKEFSLIHARKTLAQFDSHPALWGWYLVDEPDLNLISPEEVRRSQRYLKQLHPSKPTALALFSGASALHYAEIADVLMIDRYPIPWLPLANFPQHVRFARLALGPSKPLIAIVQAFDWKFYPDVLGAEKNLRPPTYEELRCMTYCALSQQANGLFYYCFDDGRWRMAEHPEMWNALKQVVREVQDYRPLFQARHLWWPRVHQFKDPATRFNAALESSVSSVLLEVRDGNQRVSDGKYILAVNTTENRQSYRFTVPGAEIDVIPVLGESRSIVTSQGWLEDNFAPYGIHIYGPLPEKESKAPIKTSKRQRGSQP